MTNGHTTKTHESRLYIITAKTNMHVGSGETSLGLVDNRVQRDVLTQLPNINASGLKGALREYHSEIWGESDPRIRYIFGSDSFADKDKQPGEKNHQAGAFRFFNANLLSIPVRSSNRPFYHATSLPVLRELLDTCDTFGCRLPGTLEDSISKLDDTFGCRLPRTLEDSISKLDDTFGSDENKKAEEALIFSGSDKVMLEDIRLSAVPERFDSAHLAQLESLCGSPMALLSETAFQDICSDYNLPLIARNNLENGRSKNLWHEQVIPRLSRFYFCLLKPGNRSKGDLEFRSHLPVQIGGNASIGYGFTDIRDVLDILGNKQ